MLTRAHAMRPRRHVGLLGPAERLDDTGRVAQNRAKFRYGRIIKICDSHDVLFGADDKGAEIYRANDVVHYPPSGLVDDASGQSPPPGKKIILKYPHHVHACENSLQSSGLVRIGTPAARATSR